MKKQLGEFSQFMKQGPPGPSESKEGQQSKKGHGRQKPNGIKQPRRSLFPFRIFSASLRIKSAE